MTTRLWLVIYIAQGQSAADKIRDALSDAGVMVRSRAVYKNVPPESNCFEILALNSEAREALSLIAEMGL